MQHHPEKFIEHAGIIKFSLSCHSKQTNNQRIMNLKNISKVATVLALACALIACEKEEDDKLNEGTDLQQVAGDGALFFQETELAFNDAAQAMSGSQLGKTNTIDGATVNDSSFIIAKRIVLTYNGQTADGLRTRGGSVILQLIEGNRWRDAGAVVQMDFNNVRMTNRRNGQQVIIQGTYYIKNINGGVAFVDQNVQHKAWGAANLTYGSGSEQVWNINRRRTFANNSGVLSVTTVGDTTFDGRAQVHVWGNSRRGTAFWNRTENAIKWSSACPGKLTEGKTILEGLETNVTVTHGVNADGTATTSGCPHGYKVQWKNRANEDKQAIIAY